MNVLALGATGAIGSQLVAMLSQNGHRVTVTSREVRSPSKNIEYVKGNAREDEFLRKLLQKKWHVILDFMVYGTEKFQRRFKDILTATDQYIFVSSARVFADSETPLTERSPRLLDVSKDASYLASDEYALSKARQEDLLQASGRRNWTIVRPYITFGEGRLQLGTFEKEQWLYRALDGRSIVFCDALMERQTTMTDGRDVARMMAALIGNKAALGEEFNLISSSSKTWSSIVSLYLAEIEARLGHRPKLSLIGLRNFSSLVPNLPQLRYDRLFDRRFDATKIQAAVQFSGPTDCRQRLAECLKAQLANGAFLPIDWRSEALLDRASGERTNIRKIEHPKAKLRYLKHRYLTNTISNRTRTM